MSIEEEGAALRAALAAEEELEERVRLLVLRAVGAAPLGLDAAHQLRILAAQLLHQRIMDARERGWSWAGSHGRSASPGRPSTAAKPSTSASAGPPSEPRRSVGQRVTPRLIGRCASPS